MVGLYDSQGVLRFTGRDRDDCLAYAELFSLTEDCYSLESVTVLVSTPGSENGAPAEASVVLQPVALTTPPLSVAA